MMTTDIKDAEELSRAINAQATAIYFHSEACGVCHAILPQLETLIAEEFPQIGLFRIDAGNNPELCSETGVFTFPTVVVYFEGKETIRMARTINLATFRKSIGRIYRILFGE